MQKVEARVGVDTTGDGKLDTWTDWSDVKETYDYHPKLAKHVKKTPAKIDLSDVPAGHAFGFELRMIDATANKSKPMIDRATLLFD